MFHEAEYQRLRRVIRPDPNRIDQDIIEMPVYIMECSEQVAMLVNSRDQAAARLKEIEAEAADELRGVTLTAITRSGEEVQKQKSEKQIETEVPKHPAVVRARERLDAIKLDLGFWMALNDGLRAKRDSLRHLADLIVAGFLTSASINSVQRAAIRSPAEPPVRRR